MCRRRLWKSVQLEALVTWAWGRAGLAEPASPWHPGLDVELAVGGQAQLLCGHVQDSEVQAQLCQDLHLKGQELLQQL